MRRSRHHRNYTPFAYLSRSRRADQVIAIKNLIRKQSDYYGGQFCSHQYLPEPGEEQHSQWFDLCFLGSDRFTFWNAMISTVNHRFWEQVSDMAGERADALITPEQRAREYAFEFEPASFSSTGKPTSFRMVRHDDRYEQFDGRTLHEQRMHLEQEIAASEKVEIFESFEIHRDYAHGIGLHIVVDESHLDRAAIERTIQRFRDLDEQSWTAPSPIPHGLLPRYDRYVGLSNAVRFDQEGHHEQEQPQP